MKELRVLSRRSKTCLRLCVSFTWSLGRQSYLVRVLTPPSKIVLERQLRKITSRKLDPFPVLINEKCTYYVRIQVQSTKDTSRESSTSERQKFTPTDTLSLNLDISITT